MSLFPTVVLRLRRAASLTSMCILLLNFHVTAVVTLLEHSCSNSSPSQLYYGGDWFEFHLKW
jgi:hypothetical protein